MRFFNRAMLGLTLLGITFVFLAAAAVTLVQSRAGEDGGFGRGGGSERVFAVTVIPIEPGSVTPEITAFGEIISGRTLELRAASGGALVELSPNFVEGGRVTAGEVLFQTDPAAAQADLDVAKANLDEANAELSEAIEALEIAKEELAAATRQFELRQRTLTRQQDLRTRGVGTEAAIEDAELALSSAETAMLGKRQALANANARINSAKTALARNQITAREADRVLNDLRVTAEFDGVITDVTAVLGGLVNPNEKLGALIDPSALEVAFNISTQQYANLVRGEGGLETAQAMVHFTGLTDPISATITRSSAAVGDGQTGREIFARLSGGNLRALRAGDFVTVRVAEQPLEFATRIPATAINAAGEVLVLGEGDRLRTARVEILRTQGDDVIIRPAGIVGEKIVKRRIPQIGAGIKVEPREDEVAQLHEEAMVELTAEEQERFTAGITAAPIPEDRKKQILDRIASGKLSKASYDRLKSRMGG